MSRSKKRRFAFQTFTETPATTPSTLGCGITHQPHEGGDGAKCGAKFAATPHVIIGKASATHPQSQNKPRGTQMALDAEFPHQGPFVLKAIRPR